jgi:regulatory protein YycI of two-component signal transduction system YycFG
VFWLKTNTIFTIIIIIIVIIIALSLSRRASSADAADQFLLSRDTSSNVEAETIDVINWKLCMAD